MSADDDNLMTIFEAEAAECVTTLEQNLIALESRPDDSERLQTCFRMVHTLKGGAATLGFEALSVFAHKLEDLLDAIRSGRRLISPSLITLLLESVDRLRSMTSDAMAGREDADRDSGELLDLIEAAAGKAAGPRRPSKGRRSRAAENAAPGASASESEPSPGSPGRMLRVDVQRLDSVVNTAGELSIARGRLGQALENLKLEIVPRALLEAHLEVERLTVELQEEVLRLRMVALGPTFRQHARTIRDISANQGKLAQLVIEGEDVEVDTSVIEHLRHPLTHLIRNAIDHGIEAPERRRQLGKDPCARIVLSARRMPGSIEVEVRDDGAGLDRNRILARARSLFPSIDLEKFSERDLDRLIFEPGFSTSDRVTEVSGRGIGLDVVRRDIEAIRGRVEVTSEPGRGTKFSLRLPLTLAMIEGFYIASGDETYVVPLDSVIECLEIPAEASPRSAGRGFVNLRGEALPCFELRKSFNIPGLAPRREHIVVLQHGRRRIGLVTDALLGGGKTVIKPLSRHFQDVPGIAGSAILGSGRVALIVDPGALVETVLRESAAAGG